MFKGENVCGFRGFSLNRECFPMNYGLSIGNVSLQSMLAQKFSHEWQFCILTAKVSHLKVFPYTVNDIIEFCTPCFLFHM